MTGQNCTSKSLIVHMCCHNLLGSGPGRLKGRMTSRDGGVYCHLCYGVQRLFNEEWENVRYWQMGGNEEIGVTGLSGEG